MTVVKPVVLPTPDPIEILALELATLREVLRDLIDLVPIDDQDRATAMLARVAEPK